MPISSPSDGTPEDALEELTWESWYVIQDWLANPIYKGNHFGFFGNPENEADTQKFWSYLEANPFPTVQEKATYMASTPGGQPNSLYSNFIRDCPRWAEKINGIIARLNATRDVKTYKELINELIFIQCPDTIKRGYYYHKDVEFPKGY